MADRLSQYSMLPNFGNAAMLQQQQAHQQQQQQQQIQHQPQGLPDAHPAMSQNQIEQARAWQQMQQFRAQGAADMNAANPAQFAEMMKRSQSLNQAHAARQQQQQQQQQQFGMGSGLSQMNSGPPVIGGSAQQQPFHDTASPHPQPSHISSGFPNMGGMPTGNPNQPQVRNPQNLFQPAVSRQLELMNMAQNQQPQNGPLNINKFNPQQMQQHQINQMREQQQQQFQSGGMNNPAELFPSPAMSNEALRRPSPHPHPANIQPPTGQESRFPGMSLPELTNRMNMIRPQIAQHEAMIQSLQQQLNVVRGGPQEAQVLAKMKEVQAALQQRKEFVGRLHLAMQKHKATANANGGPSGANPQPWMSHPQTFDGNPNAHNSVAQPPSSQLQPNPIQPSPLLAHSQSQANHLVNQGFVPQRSGPTPQHAGQSMQQHNATPFNSLPQSMAPQFPFAGNNQQPAAGPSQPSQLPMGASQGGNVMNSFGNMPNLGMIPPLDKGRFEMAFRTFCQKRNLKPDPRMLSIENRPVDLYRLHAEVLKEGGHNKIDQKDIWNIIGGRLGFVQFPGTDSEPAKSGPGVAQQISNIYKEYLMVFEQWYTNQTIENSKRMMAAGNLQQTQQGGAAGGRPMAQQMQQLIQMSQMSVADLQARGVDEKTIGFIETNRASLQRSYQEQKTFHNKMRTATLTQPPGLPTQVPDQNGLQIPRAPAMGQSPSFSGANPSQHPAAAMAARQQFLQQQQQLMQAHGHEGHQSAIQGGQNLLQGPRLPQQLQQNGPPRLVSSETIMKIKQDYSNSITTMRPVDIPIEHRLEFNQLFEQLFRQCSEMDQKLQMVCAVLKQEEAIRRLISIICTVTAQRSMLSTSNPRYIVTYEQLKNLAGEMSRIMEQFSTTFTAMRQRQMVINQMQNQGAQAPAAAQQPPLAGTNPMAPPMPVMGMQDMTSQARPPVAQLPITAGTSQPQQQLPSSLRPPPVLQAPPTKRKGQQASSSNANAASSPSPAPVQSASTPAAGAATPTATASSPPALPTKSPKTRAPAKPKAPAASKRRPSKAAPASAATPEAAQPVASSSTPSAKRPREEDSPLPGVEQGSMSSAPANEPSPPKRAKTEWESPPTEEMKKKDEVVENIKTEEDAAAFLMEQMTDLIKMAGNEGQSSLPTGISETLDLILKGYSTVPDSTDANGGLMGGEPSGAALKEATPPPGATTDAFDEFFDFSFGFAEDDDVSKAPTPDLVSSSSTNPSPESNHESDVSHQMFSSNGSSSTADIKTEDSMDPLRLGPWKNIDGGEGAYYQTNEWKWDSPMPSLDQPWAIFNS